MQSIVTPTDLRALADALSLHMIDERDAAELLSDLKAGQPLMPSLARRLEMAEDVLRTLISPTGSSPGIETPPSVASAVTERVPALSPEASADGFGRYRHVAEIGRGGMGTILRGLDPAMERIIALKVLAQPDAPDLRRKFEREVRITGQLQHPNIIAIHEAGEAGGKPYFSMPLVRGQSLGEVLARMRKGRRSVSWSLPRLLGAFVKICDAIAFAHDQGVIHRDLKPDNVMIGEFGEVLVMDWGLARVLDQGPDDSQVTAALRPGRAAEGDALRTQAGTIMGTPAYMPPEQAAGEIDRLGRTSDVYSLGAILYEMLTATPPYEGNNAYVVLERVSTGKLERPSRRAAGTGRTVPHDLEAVVLKAMARAPRDRYRSASALGAEVQAYLDGGNLSAARYTPAQRLGRWLVKHRLAVAGVLLAALAATTGALVMRWRGLADERARREARLDEARSQRAELDAAHQRASALPDPGPTTPPAAAQSWFDAQARAIDALDRLAWLAAGAAEVREVVDLAELRSARLTLCRRTSRVAVARQQFALARSWIARAAASGADTGGEQAAVDRAERQRLEGQLATARALLEHARTQELRGDAVLWLRRTGDQLVAMRSPRLCQLLMEPRYLDSDSELLQLAAITALGRLGDATTVGPEGVTASRALARRLAACLVPADDELIGVLGEALTRLGDGTIYTRELAEVIHGDAPRARRLRLALRQLRAGPYTGPEEIGPLMDHAALTTTGSFEDSMQLYARAIRLAPDDPAPLIARADLQIRSLRIEAALADIERLTALIGETPDVLALRAWARIYQHRAREALADADRALARQPDHMLALLNRAHALIDLGGYAAALTSLDAALRIVPDDMRARRLRGRARLRLGQLDGANVDLTFCIEQRPRHGEARIWRAAVHRAAGDTLAALRDLTRSIRWSGNRLGAVVGRGDLLLAMQAPERALRVLTLALPVFETRKAPYYAFWLSLGRARMETGDSAGAREALQRALREAPAARRGPVQQLLDGLR